MKHRIHPVLISGLVAFLSLGWCHQAHSQDLSNIKKEKPVKITGSIGTSNSYYTTSSSTNYRAPFSNNVFANLNLSLYGIEFPFSFYYSNNNRGFTHPFLNYGISPKYKALQIHLGYRSMNLAPMVYQHQTFLGYGAEFNWKFIRLAAFKGSLNQARSMGDGAPRPSLFDRNAIGAKVGFGNSKSYIDFIAFAASDDTLSLSDTVITNKLLPKENIVAGSRLQLSFGKAVVFSAELAASAFNENSRMDEIVVDELEPLKPWFTLRSGSNISYAGDVRASIRLGRISTMLQYKRVHPEYYSLGVPYFANNLEMAGITLHTAMFKNRLMFSASLYGQQDNLIKNQLYTNQNLVFNGTTAMAFSQSFNLSISYNGFKQMQQAGTAELPDSGGINRINHTITIMPSYNLQRKKAVHSFNGNITRMENANLNKLIQDQSGQNTLAAGIQYSLSLKESKYSINTSYNYTKTEASLYGYTASNLGAGVGKRFLKEGNLNVQGNTNIAFTQVEGLSRNTSMGATLSLGYQYKKAHNATLRLHYNQLNNYSLTTTNTLNGNDFMASLAYTYSFSVFDKSKKSRTGNSPR